MYGRVENLGDPITATPPALRARFEALFGYLTQPVNGHTFPICIGETGSAFVKWPLPAPDNNPARPPIPYALLFSIAHAN